MFEPSASGETLKATHINNYFEKNNLKLRSMFDSQKLRYESHGILIKMLIFKLEVYLFFLTHTHLSFIPILFETKYIQEIN